MAEEEGHDVRGCVHAHRHDEPQPSRATVRACMGGNHSIEASLVDSYILT